MAIKHMASKPQHSPTTVREVCEAYLIPFDTTSKVLQLMASGQMLKSIQGVKGGYILTKDLQQISYKDLARLIEGETFLLDCQSESKNCELYGKCNISSPMNALKHKVDDFLAKLTLSELLFDQNFQFMQEEAL